MTAFHATQQPRGRELLRELESRSLHLTCCQQYCLAPCWSEPLGLEVTSRVTNSKRWYKNSRNLKLLSPQILRLYIFLLYEIKEITELNLNAPQLDANA